MERKSSTLSNPVDNSANANSNNQLKKIKKAKWSTRLFNYLMTFEVIGICVCLGLIIARIILKK